MTIDPTDPRLLIPGPPGGERYLCPVRSTAGPCLWFLDVPAPEFDPPNLMAAGPSYRITVTHVPIADVEAAIEAHLRADHDRSELFAEMLAVLDGRRRV